MLGFFFSHLLIYPASLYLSVLKFQYARDLFGEILDPHTLMDYSLQTHPVWGLVLSGGRTRVLRIGTFPWQMGREESGAGKAPAGATSVVVLKMLCFLIRCWMSREKLPNNSMTKITLHKSPYFEVLISFVSPLEYFLDFHLTYFLGIEIRYGD